MSASNLIPTHKAELKRIMDLLIWDGQSFGARETAGKQHIHINTVYDPKHYPAVAIVHKRTLPSIQDTGYNNIDNIYTIRCLYPFENSTVRAEDILDELSSYIATHLFDYMFGDNSTWETLKFADGSEPYQYQDGILAKDISIILNNAVQRTPNYT